MLLRSSDDALVAVARKFIRRATNNEAEYEALIVGLELAQQYGVRRLHIQGGALAQGAQRMRGGVRRV